jgi:hypothetical protein
MKLIKKLSSLFASTQDSRNLWFFVQCDTCNEIIKGRMDIQNDLSPVYSEGDNGLHYYCRKVIVGSNRCFRPIEVEYRFDSNRKFIDRHIQGGGFVSEDDFLLSQDNPP